MCVYIYIYIYMCVCVYNIICIYNITCIRNKQKILIIIIVKAPKKFTAVFIFSKFLYD